MIGSQLGSDWLSGVSGAGFGKCSVTWQLSKMADGWRQNASGLPVLLARSPEHNTTRCETERGSCTRRHSRLLGCCLTRLHARTVHWVRSCRAQWWCAQVRWQEARTLPARAPWVSESDLRKQWWVTRIASLAITSRIYPVVFAYTNTNLSNNPLKNVSTVNNSEDTTAASTQQV